MCTLRKTGFSAIFLAAVGLVACGGSGGSDSSGSDDGDSSLSEEEQATIAAQTATATATAAQSFAGGQTTDPTGSTSSTSGRTTQDTSNFNCSEGGFGFTNDTPGFNVANETFPNPPFSTQSGLSTGNNTGKKLRADQCENKVTLNDGTEFTTFVDGASDTKAREAIDGTSGHVARLHRLGGFQGNDLEPDTGSFYELEQRTDGVTQLVFKARGEIFSCEGCVGGDLSNFSGDPSQDQAISMFLEVQAGDGSGTAGFTFGNASDDPLTLVTSDAGGSVTNVEIDGSFSVDASDEGCGFGATYNTVNALKIEDYQSGASTITDGTLEVALDGGSTNTVEFQSDGTVKVNGDEVDPSTFSADCNAFNDLGST